MFFITQLSIGYLSPAILALLIGALVMFRMKSIQKYDLDKIFLSLYIFAGGLYNIANFIGYSLYSPDAQIVWYIESFIPFGVLFLVQFAYYFPENIHVKEQRAVLGAGLILSGYAAADYCINASIVRVVLYGRTYGSIYFSKVVPVVVSIFFIWVIILFFRKMIYYEKKAGIMLGIKRIFTPCTADAKNIRMFIFIIFFELLNSMFVLIAMNYFPVRETFFVLIMNILLLFVYTMYAAVYLYTSYHNIPYLFKLIGLPVIFSLVIILTSGYAVMLSQENIFDENKYSLVNNNKNFIFTNPENAHSSIEFSAIMSDNEYNKVIYKKDKAFPYELTQPMWTYIPGGKELGTGDNSVNTALVPGRKYFTSISGKNYYIYTDEIYEKVIGFGFGYTEYLKFMNKSGTLMFIITLSTVFVLLTILPFFYHIGIITPMKVYTSGSEFSAGFDKFIADRFYTDELKISRGIEDSESSANEISVSMKKRLDKVLNYISDNYKDDLSREGLASMIDLDPDYMSKLFKVYTTKKIGDYINDMRIDEACKMIRETNLNILEISLDSGFESLRTFNRAFIKKTGITPTEYKKKVSE